MIIPIPKKIIAICNTPRLLFHCLFFYVYYDSLCEDVKRAILHRQYNCKLLYGFIYLMVFDKHFRNIFYFRIGKWQYLIKFLCPPQDNFVIGTYTSIGKGLLALHPISTIINAKSIGDNFTIKNGATIGCNRGAPIIGNNVIVNVNAVVVGPITIGDNCVIGTGTILTKNVPDNCVVVGNPAYILRKDGELVKMPL